MTNIQFLQDIPLELDAIEPEQYYDTPQDFGEGDHRVEVMTDDMKRLLTLWRNTQKVAAEYKVNARFSDKANHAQLLSKYTELSQKADVIGDIFWIVVKDEFHLWDKTVIGIRSGHIVVWTDPKPEDNLPPFLRGMIGQPPDDE